MRRTLFVNAMIMACAMVSQSVVSAAEIENITRPTAMAGQFYPGDPTKLAAEVDKYLAQAKDTPIPTDSRLVALVCPHAGYPYSAPVAAWSYRLLAQVKSSVDLVIIVGSSHHSAFKGASLGNYKAWRTPLGDLEVDADLVRKLLKENDFLSNNPTPHLQEHCLETQLPFVKKILPDAKIVPILIGYLNKDVAKRLAAALSGVLDQRKAVIIFSTDLSHYLPYEKAVAVDKKSTDGIASAPADEFYAKVNDEKFSMCGASAIAVLKYLQELRKNDDGEITPVAMLKYMNSGDTAGDKNRVVGYAAMALFEKRGGARPQPNQ